MAERSPCRILGRKIASARGESRLVSYPLPMVVRASTSDGASSTEMVGTSSGCCPRTFHGSPVGVTSGRVPRQALILPIFIVADERDPPELRLGRGPRRVCRPPGAARHGFSEVDLRNASCEGRRRHHVGKGNRHSRSRFCCCSCGHRIYAAAGCGVEYPDAALRSGSVAPTRSPRRRSTRTSSGALFRVGGGTGPAGLLPDDRRRARVRRLPRE